MCYKIHLLQLYNSMIFRKSIEFCNHLHNLVFEYFRHPNGISHTHLQLIPFLTAALGNHPSSFYLYRFAFMNIQCKCSHIICGLCVWPLPLSIWICSSPSSKVSVLF